MNFLKRYSKSCFEFC